MSGALVDGQQLPGEPAMATQHAISRVTVRRALDGLARDGLIRRHPGAGTFVQRSTPQKAMTGDLTNMLSHLAAMGRNTDVQLLAFGYGVPTPAIAEALRLKPGERTQNALRVRSIDGEPFSYLSTHVPERIGRNFNEVDLSTTPLLTLLERLGVVADKAEQTISATLAAPEAAAALKVEIGTPLLALTRVVRDPSGAGVEYLSALYRPDRHRFHMELTRAGEGGDRYWQTTRPVRHQTRSSPRREAAQSTTTTKRRTYP